MRLSALITRGPDDVVAPLRRIGDGVAHVGQAAAIDEIDDQLELVEHFEVGALGLIAGFDEGFIASLDQRADAAAEHSLLAEEIGLRFFLECGFEHSGARAADALEVAERERMRFAGRVLMDGDKAGDTAALGEDFAHAMSGSLGRGHADVDACCRSNGLEVNVEAMSEEQQFAGGKIGSNLFVVQLGGGLIRDENHDHVSPLGHFRHSADFEARLLRLGNGLGIGGKTHLYLDARVLEVEGVGMPLRTVADDGYLFRLDQREISVVIVISLCHDFPGFSFVCDLGICLVPIAGTIQVRVKPSGLCLDECGQTAPGAFAKLAVPQLVCECFQVGNAVN